MNAAASPVRHHLPTDDRRAAIAAATRALIAEKGFEGLRTRDIAERVGINVATLHYHVPTKEALIALVAEAAQRDIGASADALTPSAPEVRLERFFLEQRDLLVNRPDLLACMSELTERARRDPIVADLIRPLQERRQVVVTLLTEGVATGVYRADMDPESAAFMLIGAIIGFSRNHPGDGAGFDRLAAELRRAILNPAGNADPVLSKGHQVPRHPRDDAPE